MGTETKYNCHSENTSNIDIANISVTVIHNQQTINGSTECSSNHLLNETQQNGSIAKNGHANHTTSNLSDDGSVIPFVPLHVDENNCIDGAKEILKVIRPHWNLNAVEFKTFTDGITNKLVGCFNNETDLSNGNIGGMHTNGTNTTTISNNEKNNLEKKTTTTTTTGGGGGGVGINNYKDNNDDSDNLSDEIESLNLADQKNLPSTSATNNVVLIRIYGNKTDLLIDRKAETRNFKLLQTYGFAPSLYATFKNGLAYDYVPGVTLNTVNILKPEIWGLVARRMAEMHRVVQMNDAIKFGAIAADNQIPMLWKKTQSFFDLVPERFSDADKHKRLEKTFLPISRMRQEFESLYKRLETLNSPLVFSHNDLLLGNVIYTESRNTVNFIDYEYADYNYQAFDIGNHFAEFVGVDVVDYTLYPKRDFQIEWLRVYLQAYLLRDDISDNEVNRLYVQVNQFALAAHLFWTLWSLIQAEHSTIDFDYVDYAFVRYNEYLAKKDEFLALEFKPTNITS